MHPPKVASAKCHTLGMSKRMFGEICVGNSLEAMTMPFPVAARHLRGGLRARRAHESSWRSQSVTLRFPTQIPHTVRKQLQQPHDLAQEQVQRALYLPDDLY